MSLTQKNQTMYDTSAYENVIRNSTKKSVFYFMNASKYRYNPRNKTIPLKIIGASNNDNFVFSGDHVINDSLVYENCGKYEVTAATKGVPNHTETLVITIEKSKMKSYELGTQNHHYYSTSEKPILLQISENMDEEVSQKTQFTGSFVKNNHLHYTDVGTYEIFASTCETSNYLSHKQSFIIHIEKSVQNQEFLNIEWDYNPIRKKIVLPFTLKNTKVEYSLLFTSDSNNIGNVRLENNIVHYSCPNIHIHIQSKVENKNFKVTSTMKFQISKTNIEELMNMDIPLQLFYSDPYYTLEDIMKVYSLEELLAYGVTLNELKEIGVDGFELFNTKQTSIEHLDKAGYNIFELSKQIRGKYEIEELLNEKHVKIKELKLLGYSAQELLGTKKVFIKDLQNAGYLVKFRVQ